MKTYRLISDQFITWSDIYGNYAIIDFAQAACAVASAYAGVRHLVAWFAHRTLQALRQTWLQVCRWPRPWSQALPVGEFSWLSAANELRAASRSIRRRGPIGKLSTGPHDSRGGLRDQPRTTAPPRSALRRSSEPASAIAHPPHRPEVWRRAHCKYARSVARFRVHAGAVRGERR